MPQNSFEQLKNVKKIRGGSQCPPNPQLGNSAGDKQFSDFFSLSVDMSDSTIKTSAGAPDY